MFGFCITHILNTRCTKIWKKICRQKVKQSMEKDSNHSEDRERIPMDVTNDSVSEKSPAFIIGQVMEPADSSGM